MRYRYILGRQQARRRKGKPGPLFTRPVENAQQIVTRWKRTSNRDSAAARKERVWVRGGKKAVAKENGESKWVNKREWNEVIHQQQTNDSLISISASIHFLFFPPSAQLSPQFHDGLRSLSCCFTYQTLIDLYREREREREREGRRFAFPFSAAGASGLVNSFYVFFLSVVTNLQAVLLFKHLNISRSIEFWRRRGHQVIIAFDFTSFSCIKF